MHLQSYSAYCYGKIDETDKKEETFDKYVGVLFGTIDTMDALASFGIAPSPLSAYKLIKSLRSEGQSINSAIGNTTPKNNNYKFSGKDISLSWDDKYTYSVEYISPVKLINNDSYYQVNTEFNNVEPSKSAKMKIEVYMEYKAQ